MYAKEMKEIGRFAREHSSAYPILCLVLLTVIQYVENEYDGPVLAPWAAQLDELEPLIRDAMNAPNDIAKLEAICKKTIAIFDIGAV